MDASALAPAVCHDRPARRPRRRGIRAGVVAALVLVAFYGVVVGAASGSVAHLTEQVRADWYFLAPIVAGFGTQVALMSELRRRRRAHGVTTVAGATGAGSSAVGMVACCAHHVADLAPFAGATGAAAFLTDYRVAFMLGGIGANAVGIAVAARRLRRSGASTTERTSI